jgi:hypothetical protein
LRRIEPLLKIGGAEYPGGGSHLYDKKMTPTDFVEAWQKGSTLEGIALSNDCETGRAEVRADAFAVQDYRPFAAARPCVGCRKWTLGRGG